MNKMFLREMWKRSSLFNVYLEFVSLITISKYNFEKIGMNIAKRPQEVFFMIILCKNVDWFI